MKMNEIIIAWIRALQNIGGKIWHRDKINTLKKNSTAMFRSIYFTFVWTAWKSVWNSYIYFSRLATKLKTTTTLESINKLNFENVKSTQTQTPTTQKSVWVAEEKIDVKCLSSFFCKKCVANLISRYWTGKKKEWEKERKRFARYDLRKLVTTIHFFEVCMCVFVCVQMRCAPRRKTHY